MQSINHIIVMGHLGGDPEMFTNKTGKSWARFRLATNRNRKNEAGDVSSQATWHTIKVFGRTAELCHQYLRKGSGAIVDGYVQNSTFKKKDGSDGFSSEVVAQQVTFMNTRNAARPPSAHEDIRF